MKPATEFCQWTYDGDYLWETSCGSSWCFEHDGPVENGMNFCHSCGRKLEIVTRPEPSQ